MIALLPIVGLIAVLLLVAELLAERVIAAEGASRREGFHRGRELTRSTARRWARGHEDLAAGLQAQDG